MDIFTMVVTVCVVGQLVCTPARFNDSTLTSEESCYARMGEITHAMIKQFALNRELKGKEVTYDVSCMDQKQPKAKLGPVQVEL